jgi:hypothetical protein
MLCMVPPALQTQTHRPLFCGAPLTQPPLVGHPARMHGQLSTLSTHACGPRTWSKRAPAVDCEFAVPKTLRSCGEGAWGAASHGTCVSRGGAARCARAARPACTCMMRMRMVTIRMQGSCSPHTRTRRLQAHPTFTHGHHWPRAAQRMVTVVHGHHARMIPCMHSWSPAPAGQLSLSMLKDFAVKTTGPAHGGVGGEHGKLSVTCMHRAEAYVQRNFHPVSSVSFCQPPDEVGPGLMLPSRARLKSTLFRIAC